MTTPKVRAAVRDAMRASPLTEHKLALREFVATAQGEVLLMAAANEVGIGIDDLRASVAKLPDLDFYVPAREQRLTWQGGDDYLVAVSLDAHAPESGYRWDGRSVTLDLSRGVLPEQVVLMLQTAELKSRRIYPQPNGPGLTIQNPEDGQIGGSFVFTDASGTTRTIQLADVAISGGGNAQCVAVPVS